MHKYVHLHAHSDASIADGLFSPKRWAKAYSDRKFRGAALTDHGVMTNLLPFYHSMKAEKLFPIMGVEFYYVEDPTIKNISNRKASHIILLAKNYDGFQNLLALSKLSFTDGFYFKNRIGLEWIREFSEGLICLTACQGGILSNQIWREDRGDECIGLEAEFDRFSEIFGDDFYVEFQGHNTVSFDEESGMKFNSQEFINSALYERLKGRKGFKPIVTNDCHYILPEHAKIQKLIKDISWKGGNKDSAGESATMSKDSYTDSLWLKEPKHILKAFKQHHEYLPLTFVAEGMHNTMEVFEKCSKFEIPTGKHYLPKFRKEIDSKDIFKKLTKLHLIRFLKKGTLHAKPKEYVERYSKELAVISKYNLEDYFLIIWDLITFAKKRGIPTGLGRGSAAGCLISYLLGIVKIDPLEYGLIFERFLNENRCESGELPDIDLDFASEYRKEIKDYIYKTYGVDHVAEIGTYGRMKLRTSILDFGKAMGVGEQKDLLSITTKLDLDKEDVDDIDAAGEFDPRLGKLLETNPDFAFCVREIIGQIKSQGVHPAGMVISSQPIAEITPLKTQKKNKLEDGDEEDKRVITTQAEDKHIIAQGLMKVDILGLKEYDVIKYVIENAETPFTMNDYVEKIMALERKEPNKKVWKMFQKGKSEGVFQFSSEGMQGLLSMMQPNCINDLIAANALFRPGCLENGWHIQYCQRKHGEENVEYPHPIVEKALGDTYGVIVFQEQFMEVIHKLGGISLVDSDTIRSALGKKDKDKLNKFRAQFIAGAASKIGEERAEELWEQIEKASGYSFNRSHSAAYSVLAYVSQYLKVNWPNYFWAGQLEWDIRKNKRDEMLINRRAATDMGVEFVLPHINHSTDKFRVDEHGRVVWSLRSVKGLGEKAAQEIIKKAPFTDFDDFYKRVSRASVKFNLIQNLIYAGAFDSMGDRREHLQRLITLHNSSRSGKGRGAKRYISPSEETLMRGFADSMGFFERKIKDVRPTFSEYCITEKELREYPVKEYVAVGGMVTATRAIKTKRGEMMGFVTLTDLDEMIDLTLFPEQWAAYREEIREGCVIEASGYKSGYADRQNCVEVDKIQPR